MPTTRSDRAGQATAITALTPILAGREDELQAYLRALPRGADSPLARLPRTHVARWVVIDRLPPDPPDPDVLEVQRLLFSASIDGDAESYLRELAGALPEEAEAIWSHCAGFPGTADPRGLADWILAHHVPTSFFVSGYPDATVRTVRNSLAAREQLAAFALRAQDMDPRARLDAFRAAFPA